MKSDFKKFVSECMRKISLESFIVEIGPGPNFRYAEHFKEFFIGKKYYTLDIVSGYKPHIVGDVHRLPFKNEVVPAIICKATLEHVSEPQIAVKEIHRVLKQNGKIFCYIPFIYPYHVEKEFPKPYLDYYRFTKDAISYIFRSFKDIEIVGERGHIETLSWFTPLYKIKIWIIMAKLLDKFIKSTTTSGYFVLGVK